MPRLLPAGFVTPWSSVWAPPTGDDWLHEIKHDGFRLMVCRAGGRVRLFTRNGHDWVARYPAIAAAAAALQVHSFLIDGEVVVADAQGVASFDMLRGRARENQAFVWAFDLLERDGEESPRTKCATVRPGCRCRSIRATGLFPPESPFPTRTRIAYPCDKGRPIGRIVPPPIRTASCTREE